MPSFDKESWAYSIFALGGIFDCAGKRRDNTRKANIETLYEDNVVRLDALRNDNPDSAIQKKIKKWRRYLEKIDATPITYEKAIEVEDELRAMNRTLREMEAVVLAKRRSEAAILRQRTPAPAASFDSEEISAAEMARTFGSHHRITTGSRDPEKKEAPVVHTKSAAERAWESRQRTMASDCDQVIPELNENSRVSAGWGQHDADRLAVLQFLPNIPNAQWKQGQVRSTTNPHLRVYGAFVNGQLDCTVWTDGLSHAVTRNAGNVYIYRRTGNSNRFTRLAGSLRHAEEYP